MDGVHERHGLRRKIHHSSDTRRIFSVSGSRSGVGDSGNPVVAVDRDHHQCQRGINCDPAKWNDDYSIRVWRDNDHTGGRRGASHVFVKLHSILYRCVSLNSDKGTAALSWLQDLTRVAEILFRPTLFMRGILPLPLASCSACVRLGGVNNPPFSCVCKRRCLISQEELSSASWQAISRIAVLRITFQSQ